MFDAELYEERAAIMQYDAYLSRADAEHAARACQDTPPAPSAPSLGLSLRPYQAEAVSAVLSALARGEHPVVSLPTGSGKSVVIAALCARLRGRVLVVSHRKKLLEQDSTHLTRYLGIGEDIGIYSAGLGQRDTSQRVLFGGVQSIYKRMDVLQQVGGFASIICDEAHLCGDPGEDKMYNGVYAACPQTQRIGLSATPSRSGVSIWGEDKWFTACVHTTGIADITPQYLAPLSGILTAPDVDLSRIRVRQGEFVAADASQVLSEEKVARAAIAEICHLAQHRQAWALFCCDIAHTNLVASLLCEAGITCGVMTSAQASAENDAALAAFESGETRALASCVMMTTGFDLPRIDCIVLLRPTMSKELLIQMVGRGTRQSPEKQDCLVLDYVDNLTRHAPLDELVVCQKTEARVLLDARETEEKRERERRAKHAPSVLAGGTYRVERATCRVMPSKRQPGKLLLEVSYYCPDRPGAQWVKLWLCPEYAGFPRQQVEAFFQRRGVVAPRTAHAAAQMLLHTRPPVEILVKPEGKYNRVLVEYWNDSA